MSMSIIAAAFPMACSSDDNEAATTLPAIATAPVTSLVVVTTTLPPVDPQLVDDCVEYVQFGAFTANPLLTSMWEAAGRAVSKIQGAPA